MAKLTAKQQRFCDEYLICLNASEAAIKAGYSKKYAATNTSKLLNNTNIKECLKKRMDKKEKELIADQNEVLKYLTSVIRGQSRSSVVVVENIGDYMSEAREMEKSPDEKERLKAAELLGKAHGIFTDKVEQTVDMDLNITVDYGDDG